MLEGNFFDASGVILYRDLSGEKNLWLKLFLKGVGLVNVTARKSGGDTEPLLWGRFYLKKKVKTMNYYIDEVEVIDDMLHIRMNGQALFTAVKWIKLITKYFLPGHPDDELLANLYWSMKLLSETEIIPEVLSWKFLWRWLESWGIAPNLVDFYTSQNFNHDEIILLTQISLLNVKGMSKLFSERLSPNIRENSFKIAVALAEKFLIER